MNRQAKQHSESGFREIFISEPTSLKIPAPVAIRKKNIEILTLLRLSWACRCSDRHYIIKGVA